MEEFLRYPCYFPALKRTPHLKTNAQLVMSSSELLEAYEAAVASTPEATACEPLLKALRTAAEGGSTPLSALHLKQVALGRAGACALSALLAKDSFLTYINLEGNDICDEGAVALSGPLTSHQSIFRLDLGFNTIGPKGLRALAGVVAVSPSLLCLDLSGNNLWSRLSLLAPASMSALAPLGNALAQETCRLQLLHLDQADIEPKGLTALVDGLLDNSVLVNLRLGENALDIRSAAVRTAPHPTPTARAPRRTNPGTVPTISARRRCSRSCCVATRP